MIKVKITSGGLSQEMWSEWGGGANGEIRSLFSQEACLSRASESWRGECSGELAEVGFEKGAGEYEYTCGATRRNEREQQAAPDSNQQPGENAFGKWCGQ